MLEEAAESLSAPKIPLRGPRSGIERLVPAPLGALCGGASHEAEGRCGARGGGAGRVGPPTG